TGASRRPGRTGQRTRTARCVGVVPTARSATIFPYPMTPTVRRKRQHSRSSGPSRVYAGVPLPDRPGRVPHLPEDITSCADEELMELFSQFIGWQNYVSVSLAEADVAENDAETAVKYAEATALVETWTGA